MDHLQNHVVQEAHKIGTELRHDNFSQAHKELNKEAHNPHEFQKLLTDINHDLKQHHQHPLSVHHDKTGHISHVDFGKHDIYNSHHSQHAHDGAHKSKIHSGDDLAVARLHEHDGKNADGSPKPADVHAAAKPGARQDFLTDAQRKQLATEGNAAAPDAKALPGNDKANSASNDKANPTDAHTAASADKTKPTDSHNVAADNKTKPVDPDRAKVEEDFRRSVKDGGTIRQMDPALQDESRTFLHNLESNGVSGDLLQSQRDKLVELNNRPGENLATKKADIQQLNKLFAPPGRDI